MIIIKHSEIEEEINYDKNVHNLYRYLRILRQLCYKANSELNNSGEDKYIVCEIDGNCWDYQREELAYLCERYCDQMDRKK